MKRLRVLTVCLIGLAALSARDADAAPITFDFTATVDTISETGSFIGLTGLGAGSTISGTFIFESTTSDVNADPAFGVYDGALLSLSVQLGNVTLDFNLAAATTNSLITIDAPTLDAHAAQIVTSAGTLGAQALTAADFVVALGTNNLAYLSDDSIWAIPPGTDLSGFDQFLSIPINASTGSGSLSIAATPTAIIPEPATAFLFGLGCFGLAHLGRARAAA